MDSTAVVPLLVRMTMALCNSTYSVVTVFVHVSIQIAKYYDVKEANNQSGPCAVGYEVLALQVREQTHHTTDCYTGSYIWQGWQDRSQCDKTRIVTFPT